MKRSLILALALLGVSSTALAAPEELEVSFDLAQYSHDGILSFSRGCIATPPTGRGNWVHITVVWLEDTSGNYVTTLYRWGRTYQYNLKRWALVSDMAIDGLTSATPTSNGDAPAQVFRNFTTGVHDISWLPDGDYKIRLETTQCELADEFRAGPVPTFGPDATFTFTKGRASQTDLSLGSTAPFNNVTINYTVPAGNQPPGAWAGIDQRLMPSTTPSEASTMLNGLVDDESGNPPTVLWQQLSSEPSGLGALIASPSSAQTAVTFDTAGIYHFRLTATDAGGLDSSDDLEVWVNTYTLDASHDAEVYRGRANDAMGIIENAGPWVWAWGPCNVGQDFSRGYLRFDLRNISAAITKATLRLPWAESTPNANVHHDFHLLDDTQDDWNTGNASTDWEASTTFNNQSVLNGLASNLDPQQLIGTFTHHTCAWRHSFADPVPAEGPASACPGWIDVDLDLAAVAAYDANSEWSIFMSAREGCNNGFGMGSRENSINPQLVVVEHWQSAVNQTPIADAGSDRVVTDVLPSGTELVTLDGSGSSDDAGIVSYEWRENNMLLGSSASPMGVTVPLALGVHALELTVTDGVGLSSTDTVQIVVEDRYYPNADQNEAAVVDGDPDGKLYTDLYAYTAAGDWFAIDVVDGSAIDVSITLARGDLDLSIYDASSTLLMRSATAQLTENVTASGLAGGRYVVQVSAAAGGESTYEMNIGVDGATLVVALNRSSSVESAGTLTAAGTISISEAATAPVDITLSSDLPAHLGFGSATVTIPQGMTSVSFDIVLVDDPAGAPDTNRYVNISATAPNYNRGSAVFEILDDEVALVVTWDKAAAMIAETRSPLVVLTAELSAVPGTTVIVPFTISGTAVEGTDYQLQIPTRELTFNATTRASIPISIFDNPEVEASETIIIRMGAPIGATAGAVTEFVLTISDDDVDAMPMPMPDPNDEVTASGCGCTATGSPQAGASGIFVVLVLVLVLARVRVRVRARVRARVPVRACG